MHRTRLLFTGDLTIFPWNFKCCLSWATNKGLNDAIKLGRGEACFQHCYRKLQIPTCFLKTWSGRCESPLSELCVTSLGVSGLIKALLFPAVQLLKLLHFLLMVVPDKKELDLWKRWRCLDKLQYQSKPAWQVKAWKGKPRKPENVSVESRGMGNNPPGTSWTCCFAGVAPRLHTLGSSCQNDEFRKLALFLFCIVQQGTAGPSGN